MEETISRIPDYSSFMASAKKESAVDIIINRIADAVSSGHLQPGERLPTELQLAEMMNVSKNTVREAIKILVAYGVVEIRRPEGTFISDGFHPQMMNPLIYSILFSKENSADVMGLRNMIDNGLCLYLLDHGIRPEDEAALEKQHEIYCATVTREEFNLEAILEEDIKFHRILAAAAHNDLIYVVHDYVLQLTREARGRALLRAYEDNNNLSYIMEAHRQTLNLIEQKNKEMLRTVLDYTYKYGE